jgi:hypothetical protein
MQLIGVANEVNFSTNEVGCTALIDTGATVFTNSEDFYDKYLSHIEVYPVQEALKVECADGKHMPYLGFICTTIEPNGMPLTTLRDCLFLIVPCSNYKSCMPVVIETNIVLRLLDCKTNTLPMLMHQMHISTTLVSSVVLRPKKLEIRKQILCHEIEPNPSKDRVMPEGDNPFALR